MDTTPVPIPPVFGQTQISRDWLGEASSINSPIRWNVAYFNNLSTPVVVQWRSGLKFTLPADAPRFGGERFVVRVELTWLPTIKTDMIRLLSVLDLGLTAEQRILKEALLDKLAHKGLGGTIHLDYCLTAEQLRTLGGTVYYHELDTVFSLLPWEEVPAHPFSSAGRYEQLVRAQEAELSQPGLSFGIDLVDNLGRWGDRYINLAGKVYKIPARKDASRADGFYVVGNAPVLNDWSPTTPGVQFVPMEGVEENLCVYKSAEEAATLGDLTLRRREQIAELEHAATLAKTELQRVKAQSDTEITALAKQVKELQSKADQEKIEQERIRNRQEQENLRLKDYYESRSYERKDSSELLKALPGFILGIGAAVAAMKALA